MNAEKIIKEASLSLLEFGIAISKLNKTDKMKNLVKQIRKIKGVVTVEPAGENMTVVVFEPNQPKEYLTSVDVGLGESSTAFTKITQDEFLQMLEYENTMAIIKPKSLKPEELVYGEIYVQQHKDGDASFIIFSAFKYVSKFILLFLNCS